MAAKKKAAEPLLKSPPEGKEEGNDLMASLMGDAAPKPKGEKKAERYVLPLDEKGKSIYKMFVPAKILADYFTTQLDNYKAQLNKITFKEWVKKLWNAKTQPGNPTLELREGDKPDMDSIFVVTNNIKVKVPDASQTGGSPKVALQETLIRVGLSPNNAKFLVDNEVKIGPSLSVRPFDEMSSGKYVEQAWVDATEEEIAVSNKIMNLLKQHLTPEEKKICLTSSIKTQVVPGFFERVCQYCENEEQLQAVFTVFTPVVQNRSAHFGLSDTMEQRNKRLLHAADEFMGSEDLSGNKRDKR